LFVCLLVSAELR